MLLAAHASWRGELVADSPGEEPGLYIFVTQIVAGLVLAVGLPEVRQNPFLIGHIRFHRIGYQEIRAPSRGSGNLRQTMLNVGLQPNA